MKPYFSHDESARNDPKLIRVLMRLGQAGKGVYWDLVEMLHEQGGYLPLGDLESMAFGLRTDLPTLASLLNDFGLFSQDAEHFWSESALERLKMRNAKAEARAAAGAKGGKAKAEREAAAKALLEQSCSNASQDSSNASPNPSNATALPAETLASKEKERKEKETKEPLPSVEDAAGAAAPEPEKKIEQVEVVEPLPESSTTELRTPGGAADVGTSVGDGQDGQDGQKPAETDTAPVKLTKQRGGKQMQPEPEHFAAFWESYTRHDDRAGAVAAFRKLSTADQEAAAARAKDWLTARPDIVTARGDFRPYPATWLNKRRWDDFTPTAPIPQPVNPQQNAVYPTAIKPGAARHHVPVVTSYGKL